MTSTDAAEAPNSPVEPAPLTANASGVRRMTWFLVIGVFLVGLIPLLWNGEGPGPLHTLGVAELVFAAGVGVIIFANQQRLIGRPGMWTFLFALKLLLGVAITYFFWYKPFAPELLRVEDVVPGVQDSNLYDYHALKAMENGLLHSPQFLNFTWQSVGITFYIGLIYQLFGVSVAYVSLCNGLMALVAVVFLCGTLGIMFGQARMWNYVAFALFIPGSLFYDATPAKEALTNAVYYAGLFWLTRLVWSTVPRWRQIVLLLGLLGILAIIRANVACLLVLGNLWQIARRIGLLKSVISGAVLGVLAVACLFAATHSLRQFEEIFNVRQAIDKVQTTVAERRDAGDSGIKLFVEEQISPHSVPHLVVLAPLRGLIWIMLPYPLLVPEVSGITLHSVETVPERVAIVGQTHELCFAIDGVLMIFAMPCLVALGLSALRWRNMGYQILMLNIIVPSILIGNLMFVMGRRYQVFVDPVVLAAVLVAIHFRVGRRLYLPVLIPILSVAVLVAAVKFLHA